MRGNLRRCNGRQIDQTLCNASTLQSLKKKIDQRYVMRPPCKVWHAHRHRHRHKNKHTHTHIDTDTETDTQTHKNTHTHTNK
jgi:hypothetical protein